MKRLAEEVKTFLETRQRWLVAGLLLVFFLMGLAGILDKNATFDEVAHLPAGYSYLALGDFRMNPEHPPLAKIVAAAPLLALQPKLEQADPLWQKGLLWPFGQAFLFDWNDPERMLFWGRLPLLLLATGFGLVVWAAGRQLYGPLAGLIALILYVFTPEFLAHGPLVTTDFAVTAALFTTVFFFYLALLQPSTLRLLLLAAAAGACVTAKFSGLIVLPILLLLSGVYYALPVGAPLTFGLTTAGVCAGSREERLHRLLRLIGTVTLGCFVVIWTIYQFRYSLTPDPALSQRIPWDRFNPAQLSTRIVLLLREVRLLPESYLYGLLECLISLEGRRAFLLGSSATTGWWYYYPVSFALKTPLPLMVLTVAAFCRINRRPLLPTAVLLLPVVAYLAVSLPVQTNIGNRHILPIYPFLVVFAAGAGAWLADAGRDWRTGAVGLLLLWQIGGTVRIAPDFLAYFNELAGGPAGGHRYLADSNLDWGQDLKGLARYRAEQPAEKFYVSYFGAADPRYYLRGVDYLPGFFPVRETTPVPFAAIPSGALVAISVTNLNGVNVREFPGAEELLARLRQLEPEARIGYSIHVYRLP